MKRRIQAILATRTTAETANYQGDSDQALQRL